MMARLRQAVVALALFCCLIHMPPPPTTGAAAAASFPPGLQEVVPQDTRVAPPTSCGANDQSVVVAGEAEAAAGGRERMALQLDDYPGSGANDRHSPWAQQRRN